MSQPTPPEWLAWEQGVGRCPYCEGLSMDDFEAICDCSRHEFEQTGRQSFIQVIGSPNPPTMIFPEQKK